mmetsp:Transcript_14849/g.22677  ORF Transcript_14849/g.22677 Transcript_14849/m.22677 type:complete len:340 (-) Transcript_14849:21-1040(-)
MRAANKIFFLSMLSKSVFLFAFRTQHARFAGRQLLGKVSVSFMRRKSASAFEYGYFATRNLMMTSVDADETLHTLHSNQTKWNIVGLKKEVNRLVLRTHKKVGKVHTKLSKAKEIVEELTTKPDATLEELENCPNIDVIEFELSNLQERLQKLNELEQTLAIEKRKSGLLQEPVLSMVLELGVNDEPPPKQERGPGKKKGPKQMTPRLPYRRYYSLDNTEIRVGKKAEDNDQLSCSPEHRDGADWWMHASGCPGSHVVIRSHEDLNEEVVQDAAALAARQSKCNGSIIKVSLTRCRDVKKPVGAKAGLVQLTGKVRTVAVNMSEAAARLDRLDSTCVIN